MQKNLYLATHSYNIDFLYCSYNLQYFFIMKVLLCQKCKKQVFLCHEICDTKMLAFIQILLMTN